MAVADPGREQVLVQVLEATGEFVVAEQCLSAEELVDAVRQDGVDAVVARVGLHRLTAGAIADIERTRTPVVLLAPNPEDGRWQSRNGVVLGAAAAP